MIMANLNRKFEQLYEKISSESFLKMESLGGEIPFFISAYDPKDELAMKEGISLLIKKLDGVGIPVLELNLYDVACEIMAEKGGMERIFQVEKRRPKDSFLKALQSTVNIHEVLMPRIKEKIEAANAKVYFLTGVGLVFPFIRSHNILNNLQNIAKEAPTVTFFPGKYDGNSLNLFGLLKDDNYYRAFDIEHVELKQ
jgi:Domain of unknown function (DUF1788)